MATKLTLNLQFQRADCRAEFDKARAAVKNTISEEDPGDGAARLLDLAAALDSGVGRLKRDLLGSSLCWNEDNQAVTAWIHQQHRKVTMMAQRVIELLRGRDEAADLTYRVMALALFHWAEALKWISGRERHDYEPLHAILREAMDQNRQRAPMNWVADGRGHTVTLENIYFRALLLDRFGSGNLTRQQVEVLDAWLWEWASCLQGCDTPPEGRALHVDLDGTSGLREGRRDDEGRALYLALEPLEARCRALVRELHRGRIVPAHGCTAEFRIEEHVAVIEHLQRAFRAPEDTSAQRAPRQQEAGTRVEVWVGLPEILNRGAGVKVGTETGKWRALSLTDPSISTDLRDAGMPVRYESADPMRRYLWLADTSATGHGFEALTDDAAGIEIADLVGWRRTPNGPITLGRVIRRLPSATAGQVFIGVQLMTDIGMPFVLSRVNAFDSGSAESTFLFVPGDDQSGRRDAFLVSESTYQQQHAYVARLGTESYTIRFNRVRAKGRGWLLAGFEVVPLRRVDPVNESPTFEYADTAEEFHDPWGSEVSPRLG